MRDNRHPEFIQEIMEQEYGTRVLITNPNSDKYLERHRKTEELKKKFNNDWFDGDTSN